MINHQELREQYKPEKIKTLFIAESLPLSDTFFYSVTFPPKTGPKIGVRSMK